MFSFLLFSVVELSAQANGGTLTGKVADATSGEVLRGATVFLLNTKKGAVVDVKGSYSVKALPAGIYSVRVNYIGYQTKTIENIEILNGQTLTLNIVLESAVKKTEDVVVEVRRITDNAAAMLAQRKNAIQVSDGIGETEIKKLPDADAGQALRRVPGVTLVEGKFVYVRGINERYNNTTLNGASLTSTEPDKKAFAFDIFPTEFLQNAQVTKSFTPDLPGNFAGGLVQLNTVDFPERYALRVSGSLSYNDNITFKNSYIADNGGSLEWLGMDDGTRALPGSIPQNAATTLALLRNAGDTYRTGQGQAAKEWENFATSFSSSVWKTDTSLALPNGSIALSFGNNYSVGDDQQIGVIAAVNYANSVGINTIIRNGLFSDASLLFQSTGLQSSRNTSWGGILNLAYKLGSQTSFSLKNLYNRSSENETVILEGFNSTKGIDERFFSQQFLQKELLSSQLSGEHSLNLLPNSLLDWKIGYSRSLRDEPDFRRLRYSRDMSTDNPFLAEITGTQQGSGPSAGRFFSLMKEHGYTLSANLQLPFSPTLKVKTGMLYENKDRSFNARSFTFIQAAVISGGQFLDQQVLASKPSDLFHPKNFNANGIGMSEDSKPSDSYTAGERLLAGYVMADLPMTLGDKEFRIIVGARIEDNIQHLYGYDLGGNTVNVEVHTTDVLPSFNMLYKLTPDMNLRASASQTLTRPSLREFAPFAFFDFQSLSIVTGNPNLTRTLIQNYDLRYEVFPGIGEVFAVSLFYKRFEKAIEETILPQSTEIARTFVNATNPATNYGLEFEIRKNLGFLFDFGQNIVLNLNYTAIHSEISVLQGAVTDTRPMWGQAPYSLNLGVFVTEPTLKTGINLSYNIVGRKIIQVGAQGIFQFDDPHVYEMPRGVLDFSLVQPVGESTDIKLTGRDLLNQALIWEQGGKMIASNIRGRTISFGVSHRF